MQFAATITQEEKKQIIEWVNNNDQFSETQKAFFRRLSTLQTIAKMFA